MRSVIVLGSTGSIGTQALDLIRAHPGRFAVLGLAAGGGNLQLLAEQIVEFAPAKVTLASGDADELRELVAMTAEAAHCERPEFMLEIGLLAAPALARVSADVVLNAITGAAGLLATISALEASNTLALANKESLVIGGRMAADLAAPGQIVPVDSEHSAIAQSLLAGTHGEIARLILTASGGPFRGWTRNQLAAVTPEQALAHPTWNMGRVVTINSSTLVNKGLELIEAHLLFDVPFDRIQVVVHPQSVVHSGVEFADGALITQASPPDMKIPIALGLDWPRRLPHVAQPCDFTTASTWTFEPLDEAVFPAVALARRAGEAGGTAPAVFNAANEACVDAFCARKIGFLDITATIARVLDQHLASGFIDDANATLDDVLAADHWGRAAVSSA
ncbi:MAG: 1-deoxy-D-xylulose-5-phosphate reductoisomerase [Propionibacteriaceae bacterium]|jgi:1-deoxy-D-xylulose-5-phosphate reductoisomerase|nr:1-deoxy-D-xylulose-5-phosphate reductoisomerase [Propionibacteriaceae bacterium]